MVETTQGNSAEPRRPKKDRPERPAIRKTSKAEALAQLAERPDLSTNVSAAERPSAPPVPVAGAMASPSHDEPFQAEPLLRDEQPRQEAPGVATMVDERP